MNPLSDIFPEEINPSPCFLSSRNFMLCASPALTSWADFWHFPFVLSHKQLGKILHAIRNPMDSVGEPLPWFATYFSYTGFLFLAGKRWFI
jgi:hypothetical protein